MLIIGQSFIGTDGKNPTKQSEQQSKGTVQYPLSLTWVYARKKRGIFIQRREGWGQSLQHQLEEGLQMSPPTWTAVNTRTCNSLCPTGGDRRTARSTGCHPHSGFSKRPCLKGEGQRARQQHSCGSLHLHHANPVLNSGEFSKTTQHEDSGLAGTA